MNVSNHQRFYFLWDCRGVEVEFLGLAFIAIDENI
jgi:hypothetical protein